MCRYLNFEDRAFSKFKQIVSFVCLAASGGMAVIAGVFKLVIIMDQTGIQTTLWASRTPTLPQRIAATSGTATRSKYQQAPLCRYCKANLVKTFGLFVVYYGQSTIVLLPLCVYASARVQGRGRQITLEVEESENNLAIQH